MELLGFHDGNITDLIDRRPLDVRRDNGHSLQMHSSMIRRLSQERQLEGHLGCVNAVAWNSKGSLLISGSDDTRVNIYSYSRRKLLHSIETGHSANIFCTKFVPETSDELVVSGAGDAQVRLFNLSRLSGSGPDECDISPSAVFQCHSRRVKKLAVEVGNPNVVWSASEDGTLRQHDFREASSCPSAGSSNQECRNVLLDLRCGSKKSLADPPKQLLALKSCDISSVRPHLLLIGGSDSFARLYDRRMLPPLSSGRKMLSPPSCVNYFCPMHLSDRGHSTLHLTHVAFSPNGEEVLLSYSGEHVYLMDVNHASDSAVQYTSADASKIMTFTPVLNGVELQSSMSGVLRNGYPLNSKASATLEKCRRVVQIAEKSLENTDYFYGIEACNEVLDGHGREIGPTLMYECLCIRAALLLKRKWKNDAYMALRDCCRARKINSSSFRALHIQSEALLQLGKQKEALEFAIAAQAMAPLISEVAETLENIKKHLAAAEAEKNSKANDGAPKPEPRAGRVLSLSDILYRSEANSDASQDGPRLEREDSDSDEELELDFEISVSGDEGHDIEANVLHGSLNLRIHRRGDSSMDTIHANSSCKSPTSSSQSDRTTYQPEAAIDLKQRYVGHCNVGTDIKQASFLGERGEYVASGSDDGRWFIWEKKTGRLIKILVGDEAVVNCVQCHPCDCVVATSGIDSTIKIWTPTASIPSIVAAGPAGPENDNVLDVMESNQRRLYRYREMVLPFELLERFRMHEFSEGTHPF
ncbi:protein ALTERED SEED GERMINATION 2-like isoform X2 [Actinidia eriantha]|uniref:protein ALTERED SEED GERMINATION 2-like isoform X2 n=1 Tax=Actinidia eriantha TaxID=165200 RepID=UPI00258FFFDF|nr:protein ALTERED SEED GERMINATION 2-like isoform X2 [Actinidia eriantha]XP_057469540.1 protein ALTERED SEED GERMINATION 2-like isoform X2 [Actinidia eriantha]XP_057469541.1 protein ALTERED SEED GERMINATION 2-like isoform X2 [Actinidia eriantha]